MPNDLRNILLVEDNPEDARILKRLLSSSQRITYELLCVEDLESALQILRTAHVDIVLLDLSLPDSAGLDTVTKAHSVAPHVPIVVLTGVEDETLGLEAVRLGAQEYLVKGYIDKNSLVRAINYSIERKRNEAEILDQAELLRSVLQSTGDGMIVTDLEGNSILSNSATEKIFGMQSADEPISKRAEKYGLFLPDMTTHFLTEDLPLHRAIRGEFVLDEQIFVRNPCKPDGIWISENACPLKDASGKIIGAVVSVRDITEQKLLADIWRKYEFIVNTSKDLLLLISSDTAHVAVNEAYCHALGSESSQVVGKTVPSVWGNEKYCRIIKQHLEACFNGNEVHCEESLELPGIGEKSFDMDFYPYPGSEGKVTHCVLVMHDISERTAAAAELRKMNVVLSNAVEGISQVDSNGTYCYMNDAYAKMVGYGEGDLLSEPWQSIFLPEHKNQLENAIEHVQTAGRAELDVRAVRKDMVVFNVHILLIRELTADGAFAGFYCFIKDITEQVKSQELKIIASSLERSNKELDDFASVVSHDLQEPLRKIKSFGDLLKLKCTGSLTDEGKDYVNRMQNASTRMQALIDGLLKYAQVTGIRHPFKLVDLCSIAKDVICNLEVSVSKTRAKIEFDGLPTIEADPMQMNRLFQNLISNALKFQKAGTVPHITISSRILKIKDRSNGKWINEYDISFVDNGVGFDDRNAHYLFAIFRRLKEHSDYEGNGIGLAICRKIVESHCGRISAKGRPGEGATFTVTLPEKQPAGGTLL